MKKILLLLFVACCSINHAQLPTIQQNLPKSVVHWRAQSPVKHQGVKHTCTAFAIAAAMETFPGIPDLSEKYLYGIQKANEFADNKPFKRGHHLYKYIPSLMNDGAIKEKHMPYRLTYDKRFEKNVTLFDKYLFEAENGYLTLHLKYKPKAFVFVTQYEYLNTQKIKNIAYIKQQLHNGVKAIPVSYVNLYAPAWKPNPSRRLNTITPDLGFKITSPLGKTFNYSTYKKLRSNLNQELLSDKVKLERTDVNSNYSGHAVTIIGYDEEGFIIKNSYGPQWRMGGYERISYDFHTLFSLEGLIIRNIRRK